MACTNGVQEGYSDYDEEDDLLDVFDITEAEPDLIFVNPFGCQMDPLCWRELQVCWLEQYSPAKHSTLIVLQSILLELSIP